MDFQDYETKLTYINEAEKNKHLQKLLTSINEQKLTKKERDDMTKEAQVSSEQWRNTRNEAYFLDKEKLKEKFFEHCRDDMYYGEYLTEKAQKTVENMAINFSTSNELQDIHRYLDRLDDLVHVVYKDIKNANNA